MKKKKKKIIEAFLIKLSSDNGKDETFHIHKGETGKTWKDVWEWYVMNGFKDNNRVTIEHFTPYVIE